VIGVQFFEQLTKD